LTSNSSTPSGVEAAFYDINAFDTVIDVADAGQFWEFSSNGS